LVPKHHEFLSEFPAEFLIFHQFSSNLLQTQLTPKIVFCNPNGIGVRRANSTTLKARGPDMTLNIARPVSVFINLKIEMRKFFKNFVHENVLIIIIIMRWNFHHE